MRTPYVDSPPSASTRAPLGQLGHRKDDDAPQIIAHLKPFEPPPRAAKSLSHTPKSVAAAESGGPSTVTLCADVSVGLLWACGVRGGLPPREGARPGPPARGAGQRPFENLPERMAFGF